MNRARDQRGIALVTTVLVVGVMLVLGTAMFALVLTQTGQTRTERVNQSSFNLAESVLNADAFLLGRNWPQSSGQVPNPGASATPCSGQTLTGTVATPASTTTPAGQIQSVLAQTFTGGDVSSASRWWVTACESGGRTAWDDALLAGAAYDPSVAADPTAKSRRMWVRAEALVRGRRRAVVGLVQAGQTPVFPRNLAVVTGTWGTSDLVNTVGTVLTGQALGPLLGMVLGGTNPIVAGTVGLRCSLLDQSVLLGCLAGLFKATSATPLGPLLQGNHYVDFRSDTVIRADQLAQLRRQAQAMGTYYATDSSGAGTVAAGAACLPANSAGKIVFIEKVGNGTGSCVLNTAGGKAARALIVGSGGVRVTGGGTYTGVIHVLHHTALSGADVSIEGSKVVGGVFVDNNPALAGANRHGKVVVVPPAINMSQVLTSITSTLPLCKVIIVGPITCGLTSLLGQTLDGILGTLGITATQLAAAIVPQLNPALPAVTYDANVVGAVAAFGDSSLVTGTFREVPPRF
jgi:type II secretory pathway pseudopilin PulG